MRKLIYSKQYPKSDIKLPAKESCKNNGVVLPSWEDVEYKISQNITFVNIPGRWENSRRFINIATDISKACKYDIRIYETDELVEVLLSFDSHSTAGALNRLFRMADDFSFFAGVYNREITVSVDYYTLAVCRDGVRFMPDNRYYFD